LVWLENSRNREVVSFSRKAAGQEVLVVINLSNRPVEVAVKTGEPAGFEAMEFPGHLRKGVGNPAKLQLPGFSWSVFKK
jgi:glycosidase